DAQEHDARDPRTGLGRGRDVVGELHRREGIRSRRGRTREPV
ncbi:MAG: hypothetical protein AVDCRST_MAG70-1559, partial [uncultured Thermomicrobiales bacterium]